jgi:hypothetical protein
VGGWRGYKGGTEGGREGRARWRGNEPRHKQKEETVIAPAYAVAHPRAVVVKFIHAVVTKFAVLGAGRPVYVTRLTIPARGQGVSLRSDFWL